MLAKLVPLCAATAALLLCFSCIESTGPANAAGGRSAISVGGLPAAGGSSSLELGGASQETGGTTSLASGCCTKFSLPSESGQITVSGLAELSGLAASRAHPGVLYAQSDSGTGVVYAMSVTGTELGTFTLSNVKGIDWEDIAVGPGPNSVSYIYVGDIGDNAAREGGGTLRQDIIVYRLPEPNITATVSVGSQTITDWKRLRLKYPDGAHDAETLMVDPITGDLLIVTKEDSGASKVFRAAGTTPPDTTTVLELQATLSIGVSGKTSALVTAGDISPNGDSIILRTRGAILLWCRQSTWASTFASAPAQLPDSVEPQAEALTFSADGKTWYSGGEGSTTIYQGVATCSQPDPSAGDGGLET
jgi:hypothetical protein